MNLHQRLSAIVEHVADACSRALAPAMPWLFVAMRRALIATLTALVVALLFFVVPQSREVLHGLGEAPLKSVLDFNGASARLINVSTFLYYVGTAVSLAIATWYAARLLTTVEATNALPHALSDDEGSARLRRATTWFPRGLGVFVLAAAIGALLHANWTPVMSERRALGMTAVAIGGPLLAVAGRLTRRRWVPWLGVTLWIAATAAVAASELKWRLWLATSTCAVLPSILLLILVARRRILARFGSGGRRQKAYHSRDFGEVVVTLFTVVAVGAVLLLLLAWLPVGQVRAVGSAAAVLLFLAATVLFLSGIQMLVHRVARNVAGLTTFACAVFGVLVAFVGDESLGEEELEPTRPVAVATQAASAPAAPAPAAAEGRTFYVNAFGGGLRAAVFTAHTLARADDLTCGRFGERVAVLSGVSGGSLGIATYLLVRQEHKQKNRWKSCIPGAVPAELTLTRAVLQALVQDHLSPAVARMLAVDAPHWSPKPARGQALLESWQSALVEAMSAGDAATAEGDAAPIAGHALRLSELSGGMDPPPMVYFNATDADTGHVVWFSNRDGSADLRGRLTVGQAVLHSARFPIVTPAGRFGSRRLVDGGYIDNSGALTLREALAKRQPGLPAPWVITIDGNPRDASPARRTVDHPPMLTAVGALLKARTAHAELAVEAMGIRSIRITLEPTEDPATGGASQSDQHRTHPPPLGWYMSYQAAESMGSSVRKGVQLICEAAGTPCPDSSQVGGPHF